MKKRALSLLLATVLLLGFVSTLIVPASAATTRYWPVPGYTTPSQYYHSGHKAIDISGGERNCADLFVWD